MAGHTDLLWAPLDCDGNAMNGSLELLDHQLQ